MTMIGSYEVVRPLSQGGMAEALLARSRGGRLVVLKRPLKRDGDLIERMRDEAKLGSRLYHAHVVETLDVFDDDGMPVIALSFVEGPTVDELRRGGPLSAAATARIGCHIAEGLGALHSTLGDDSKPMRAVHRDVTARNVLVDAKGDAILIDLGIARFDDLREAQTETGMVLGTLRYLAPEILEGTPASPASDLWALGCVMFEAVTGKPSYGGSPGEIAGAIATRSPLTTAEGQAIEPGLRRILEVCFARKPSERFQYGEALSKPLRALEEKLGGGAQELQERVAAHLATVAAAGEVAGGVASPVVSGPVSGSLMAPAQPAAQVPIAVRQPVSPTRPVSSRGPPSPLAMPSLELARPNVGPQPQRGLYGQPAPPPALELAVEPRRVEKKLEAPSDARDWYPEVKKDYSWLSELVIKGAVVAVILAGILWWWRGGEEEKESARIQELRQKAEEEDRILEKALRETPEGCADGGVWRYKDARGRDAIADQLGKIPEQFRPNARCVMSAAKPKKQ